MTNPTRSASSDWRGQGDGATARAQLKWLNWLAVAAVVALGMAIRLPALRTSLWLDEFSTLWAVESTFAEMVRRVPTVMGQSQFFFALVWVSIHTLGESETALRLPALLAAVSATVAVAYAGFRLRSMSAAICGGALFWLCYSAAWESVEARPYSLAMACAALATAGFIGAVKSSGIRDRVFLVVGSAGLFWAHYIFAPMLLGLAASYLLIPTLRSSYTPRLALTDAALAALLASPAVVHGLEISLTPSTQTFLFAPKVWSTPGVLAPFSLMAWFPVRRSSIDPHARGLRQALGTVIATQFVAIGLAWLCGVDLVDPRYASAVIVPAAILAGDTLSRLSFSDAVAPVVLYTAVTGLTYAANHRVFGSWTGAGFQDWRGAVVRLRSEMSRTPGAPLMYRPGNAEDDLWPPGILGWPAVLAPLRSPGQTMPNWNVVPLTYRWGSKAREGYFSGALRVRLEGAPVIYLLCAPSAERDSDGYCGAVGMWMSTTWPRQFDLNDLGPFQGLVVQRFVRH